MNKVTDINEKYRDFVIELPWPDPRLNPNEQSWRAKIRPKKEAKDYAYKMTRSIHRIDHDPVADGYILHYTFHPPDDYRRRDIDNFVASMKPSQDGIAKALDIDDSNFELGKPEWGEPVSGGKVVLRLEELENGTDN